MDAINKENKMTKEEALTLWLPVIKMGVKDMPECNEALDMATKALEQESILDKIRAEVLEYIDDLDIAMEICGIFDKYIEKEG